MFTNKITISAIVIAVFAVIALTPVTVSNFTIDTTTVSAFGSSGGDGGGSGGGGDSGCGGCGGDTGGGDTGGGWDPTPEPEPEPEPAICHYLKADGQTGTLEVPYGTQNVSLTWETSRSSNVTLNGSVVVADNTNGKVVAVSGDETFRILAQNADGNDSCVVKIEMDQPEDPSLTCQDVVFEASDTTVDPGTSVNLAWVFTGNVGSASLSPNVADPMAVDNVDVTVNDTVTYYMEIANSKNEVSCPLTITVADDPETISCADNVTFTADDYALPKGGGDVTLSWTTTGIDAIDINGVSSTNLNDSEVVNVASDRTYTLKATADGQTINCPLEIDVSTGGGGGSSNSPRCDLDISDDEIVAGEEVTLSWNTSRTEEVRIEDNHGNVLIDTDDEDELDGEITIKPTKDTEFTLYATRGTRERECDVEVEVEGSGVTVFESRSQEPRVAGISLTQVPYTGFEAGPALTTLFYVLLTLWGLFVAYVVVIRRDKVAGVSLAGAHDHVSYSDQSVEADSTHESSVAEGYVYESTTTDVPANLPTATEPLEKIVGYDQYVEKKMMEK